MTRPSIDRVNELLSYDPLTGIFTWKVRRGPKRAGERAGCINVHGYRVIGIDYTEFYEHQLAIFITTGEWPPMTDHRNVKRGDNVIENLQPTTPRANARNRNPVHGKPGRNKSGVIGVHRHSTNPRWIAEIRNDDRNIYLGSFVCFGQAVAARRSARHEMWS